jgi:hypothetical protein
MRRLAVAVVWMAALATITVAVGLRFRAHRLADPVQSVLAYVREVPPEFAQVARVVGRGPGSLQVEINATPRWVRTFATRNGFEPADGALIGLNAERWTLLDTKRPGAVLHLLAPLNGGPALLTAVE